MATMIRPLSDDRSFRRILYGTLLFYLILMVITMVYPLPEKRREDIAQLPPRIAKMILEAPKEEPKPKAAEGKTEAKKKETPEEKAQKAVEKNREVARKSGILKALGQDASRGGSLREILQSGDLGSVLTDLSPLAKVSETAVPKMEISVPTPGGGGAGSVASVAQEIRTASETQLSEKKTAVVSVPTPKRTQSAQTPGRPGERNRESIAAIVASYRGGIDFIYKKTLRENPLLKGVVTVEFTIAPSGEVTQCRVVSSTVNDPGFEALVVKRILQWKFPVIPGGQGVTVTYPLEFSPV